MGISVCIITLNEEKHIEKCILSVASIVSEVVVVDSGSRDRTVEIAEGLGAKVFYRKFDNYSNQKNYAVIKAKNDWILSLDADEIIEQELAEEISQAVDRNMFDGFSIPRKNIILGKFIRYTRWQPELDRHVWLFRKSKSVWVGKVHEEVVVNGKVGKLKNAKIHRQYDTIPEFLEMIENYSTLEAREKREQGIGFSLLQLTFSPIYNFLVRYFYRLGFLDGWRGLVLSLLMAYYQVKVWIKVRNFKNNA